MEGKLKVISAKEPHVFHVSVEGNGVPDFRIKAENEEKALKCLLSEVYYALDGREDVEWV